MGDDETGPKGHRERLRQRLLTGGPEALLDYELLEYLLCLAIPRRDTKPLAKRLIAQFGGLPAVLTAEPEALAKVKGVGETAVAAIKIAQASALHLLRAKASDQP